MRGYRNPRARARVAYLYACAALLSLFFCALAEESSDEPFLSAEKELHLSEEHYLDLINEDDCGMTSLYWPWVVETTDRVENAMGKYYMYFSTDHAGANGGIYLAYSDNLLSGWTFYGKIYVNTGDDDIQLETETPSVIWNEEKHQWIMYFHSAASYQGEAQTSWRLMSEDGIEWKDKEKLFALDSKRLYGNLHNGYMMPFEYKGMLFAYSLMSGGNGGTALSWSTDSGLTWTTDHRQLGRWNLENDRYFSQNHGTVVELLDEYWWLGMLTDFSSGKQEKNSQIALSHISDMRTLVGKTYTIRETDDPDFESSNIRSLTAFSKGNKLYVYYHCCVGGSADDNTVGKDFINCLVIERNITEGEDGIPEDVIRIELQPQDATVKYGDEIRLTCSAKTAGGAPLSYQWLYAKSGDPIEGATESTLVVAPGDAEEINLYMCEVTSPGMKYVRSRAAKVVVEPEITFIVVPDDVTIMQGETARLVCVAECNNGKEVAYQWRYAKSGTALNNGQASEFTVPNNRPVGVTLYKCEVTVGNTVVTSRVVTVTVKATEEEVQEDAYIVFTVQPEDTTTEAEVSTTLTCEAVAKNGEEVTYQWRYGQSGGIISGATGSVFVVPDDRPEGVDMYKCEASVADHGSRMSRIATVTITPSTKPRIEFLAQPANASVVEGQISRSLSVSAVCTDGSPLSYQWYSNTTNKSSKGTPIEGATGAIFALPSDLSLGAYYYYCVVSAETAKSAASNAAVVLVLVETEQNTVESEETSEKVSMYQELLLSDLYRLGRTLITVSEETNFLSLEHYDNIIASSLGKMDALYQQQFHYQNAEKDAGHYIGGFDTVPFIMNNGEYDAVIACELILDGMWFSKAPDWLSVTFTDGTNYIIIYSDDKRPSETPTHTLYEAYLNGVETSGVLAKRHNIIAHPSVLYSPRFRIDKDHDEISLWVCDQLIQSAKVEGLSSLGETRVELRFKSAEQNAVSMFLRQITLRLDC